MRNSFQLAFVILFHPRNRSFKRPKEPIQGASCMILHFWSRQGGAVPKPDRLLIKNNSNGQVSELIIEFNTSRNPLIHPRVQKCVWFLKIMCVLTPKFRNKVRAEINLHKIIFCKIHLPWKLQNSILWAYIKSFDLNWGTVHLGYTSTWTGRTAWGTMWQKHRTYSTVLL